MTEAKEARLSEEKISSGTAKGFFTNTQLANGASNAGISVEQFGRISVNEANQFVNPSAEVNPEDELKEIKNAIRIVRINGGTRENAEQVLKGAGLNPDNFKKELDSEYGKAEDSIEDLLYG